MSFKYSGSRAVYDYHARKGDGTQKKENVALKATKRLLEDSIMITESVSKLLRPENLLHGSRAACST